MIIRRLVAVMLLVAGGAFADDQLVVDRGLPRANWNNDAGVTARSNVRWTL